MRSANYDDITKQNPLAALTLFKIRYHLPHVATCFYPEDATQGADGTAAYDEICHKMGIKNRPTLMVIDDKALGWASAGKASEALGFYMPLGKGFVCLKRSVYESFVKGEPMGEYVMKHELGHASGEPNRRAILKMGLAAAAGIGSGYATYKALTPDSAKADYTDRIVQVIGSYFGASTGAAITSGFLTRSEEFYADDMARKAIGNDARLLLALSDAVLSGYGKRLGEDYIECTKKVASEFIHHHPLPRSLADQGITEDEYRRIVQADFIAFTQQKPLNLFYPTISDRIARERKEHGITFPGQKMGASR